MYIVQWYIKEEEVDKSRFPSYGWIDAFYSEDYKPIGIFYHTHHEYNSRIIEVLDKKETAK